MFKKIFALKNIKRVLLLLFCIFSFFSISNKAISQPVAIYKPDTIIVGVYVNYLSDINYAENSVDISFWIWYIYSSEKNNIFEESDFPYAKIIESSLIDSVIDAGKVWSWKKVKIKEIHNWDLKNYPFDKQIIELKIEPSADNRFIILNIDSTNSNISGKYGLDEYIITDYKFIKGKTIYNTTFGDPTLADSSTYSNLTFQIFLQRKSGWITLLKLLTGVIVAFFISLSVFFIKPTNVDPRFGLCVGGLFASIGNKYIVETIVPSTITYTMLDTVHIVTFIAILAIVIISIVSLHYYETKQYRISKKIDKYSFWSILITYLSINTFVILKSL